MKPISGSMRNALGVCVSAMMLAGCGGSQTQTEPLASNQQSSTSQMDSGNPLNRLLLFGTTRRIATVTRSDPGPSWMAPDAVSRARLLYVTDPTDGDAYALSLPTGKLVGKLTGFNQPLGDCVDEKGDVFIAISQSAQVREYKHGAKEAFNVLNDSLRPGAPLTHAEPDTSMAAATGRFRMGSSRFERQHLRGERFRQQHHRLRAWSNGESRRFGDRRKQHRAEHPKGSVRQQR